MFFRTSLLLFIIALNFLPLRAQTGKWTQLHTNNSPSPRMGQGMAPIGDDKVLLFAGLQENHYDSDETWIFDLSDNEWTKVDCKEHPRACEFPAFSKIDSNKVLLFGGSRTNDIYYDETWLFDLDSMKWTQLHPAKSPHSRNRGIGAYLGDGKVLVYGGVGCEWHSNWCDDFCSDTWIYDLKKNTWDSVAYCYPYGRELPQACELNNGRVFLYGGHTNNRNDPDHFIYGLDSMKWTFFYPEKGTYIRDASALVNLDGNICLVFGGLTEGPNGPIPEIGPNGDTWLFDLKKNFWKELDLHERPDARVFHNISRILDKKSLLFGGDTEGKMFDDTWLFELTSNAAEDIAENLGDIEVIDDTDRFRVRANLEQPSQVYIELYDLRGIIIKNIYNCLEEQYIDVPISTLDLHPGIYFVRILAGERAKVKKIEVY